MADSSHPTTKDHGLITSGPIFKAVIRLAIPVVLGMLMEVALSITDFFWVGRLGAAAQDAVTSAMIIIWTVFSAVRLITIGVTALVARYIGASDPERAAHFIRQAILLATIIGGVVSAAGFLFSPALLDFMEAGAVTKALAVPYLQIFFVTSLFLFWAETFYAVFRAAGDTRTPTIIGVGVVIINMVLDPIFIFGLGPIPALGVTGAAVASAIALASGAFVVSRWILNNRLGFQVGSLWRTRPQLEPMLKIARIGLPIASQQFVFVLVYWFLIGFVHRFGESAGAAMGIGNRMESLSYLTCYGFSLAASTLVGQNLGAGKPDRAAKSAWCATELGVGLTLLFSALLIVFPEMIAGIFSNDPHVCEIAVDYLVILGLSQTAMAVEIIIEGAFAGAGDTMPPMIVMIPGSLARIPLAWYLAFELGWGISGVWWTLTITTAFKAIVIGFWFYLGRWKTKKL